MQISSTDFKDHGAIPPVHSKDGGNVSPRLSWSGVPEDTRSLALIVDDPDAPSGLFTHWIVYGIDPATPEITPRAPAGENLPGGARQGVNGFGQSGYGGPQPPNGLHRYVFHLYALNTETDLPPGLTREEIDGVIHGHVIEEAMMTGTYRA
jgi:Raf kinase inhibitor-like YbhB/YbcL family protein